MPLPSGSELTARASIESSWSVTSAWRPWSPFAGAVVERCSQSTRCSFAGGDAVEVVLQPGREVVVDQLPEVLLEQAATAKAMNVGTSAVPFLKT